MRIQRSTRRLFAAIVAVAVGMATGCGAGAGGDDAIKIGVVFPLSGTAAPYGEAYQRAAEMAFAEVNAGGGVDGRKVEVVSADDASDPARGASAVRRLIQRDGVHAIFGGTYTPPTLAEAQTARQAKIVFYSPGSSAPQLSEEFSKYVFQANFTLDDSALPVAELVASMTPKPIRIGFVKQNDAYGDITLDNAEQQLAKHGLEITETQTIGAEAANANAQVSALREADVQVVILGATTGPISQVVKEAYAAGLRVPFVSFGGGAGPAIDQIVSGEAPVPYYAITPLACDITGPCAKEFRARFAEKFPGVEPGPYDAQGYVAAKAFVEGLRAAEDPTDTDSLIAALEQAKPVTSKLTPYPIEFSAENHRGTKNSFLYGYRDGKLAFIGNRLDDNQIAD